MGAWGTGIFDNDTSMDIKHSFHDLLSQGFTINEIKLKIKAEFDNWEEWDKELEEEDDDEITDGDFYSDREDYLVTMNYLLWEVREKDDLLFNDFAEFLKDFDTHSRWEENKNERKKVLQDLLKKVSIPKSDYDKNEYDDFLESRTFEIKNNENVTKPWWKFW